MVEIFQADEPTRVAIFALATLAVVLFACFSAIFFVSWVIDKIEENRDLEE